MLSPIRRRRWIEWQRCSRSFKMRVLIKTFSYFTAISALFVAAVMAQDLRVGLKPGFRDAGVAKLNLELIWSLPKPDGFFDPTAPAGAPFPPERPPERPNDAPPPADDAAATVNPPPPDPAVQSALSFANSDLAFSRDRLIMGSFHGFNMYNVEDPRKARLLVSVVCPGGQGDVSVYGNLLFMSVEQSRGRIDCGTQGVEAPVSNERFRGVRIFDISDLRHPRQVAAVQTCRGSHTHTLVVDPKDPANVYIYVSGTSPVRPVQELAGCSGGDPQADPNTAYFRIDVIKVPLAAPEQAKIVGGPRIFADSAGAIAGLWKGGDHGPGTQ